ncbi:C40 family peptidase [Psychrobacter sp. Rd 27.2]|uniref:C40 family peptidase n=1 Tax=Psychrobacter sp. Rd 27.2 TaxID=1926479 RepID=UPI000946B997|nr:Mov34/MPN/PAD-1 family protein [Psychrobacter sp. Rd 27.2]OLF40779.1 phage tail protein [Psychrobacter sp. Rd 27.2]
MLTAKIKKTINAHANTEYPREACGVIVNGEYIPCTNVAADDAQFEIDVMDIVGASKEGEITAYVHSHPDGTTAPSQPDRVQMNLHGLPWIITNGIDVEIHKPDDYQAPLLGREYHHGIMDCYTLIQDYYQRELGITLGDYERADAWWEDKDNKPLYLDGFKNEGFVEVDAIQKHDLILCRLGRTEHVNHALVFIGDGKLKSERTDDVIGNDLVLHHPYGRESLREIYGEQWQRRAAVIIRHKSLM